MLRRARVVVLSLAAMAALAAAGCGNKEETATVAHTEGIYVGVDDLTYQVQISRILNPNFVEDAAYLKGLPAAEAELAADEVWFGIFMRVENETDEPLTATGSFRIVDTQDEEFTPVPLDPAINVFGYQARSIPAGGQLLPVLNSPAADNTIQGALVLFKLPVASLQNRPLELQIESERGGDNAVIDLDV